MIKNKGMAKKYMSNNNDDDKDTIYYDDTADNITVIYY